MQQKEAGERLFEKHLISASQLSQIRDHCARKLFSLRGEILFFLFAGVSLFCAGAGIIIYEHIGSWGHCLVLFCLLALTITSFYFPVKSHPGYSPGKVETVRDIDDYLLLAGSLLGGLFLIYLQVQYGVFGSYNDLPTLLASLIYLWCAYYFDHRGVLSLAISTFCAAVGLSLTPAGILGSFSDGSTPGYLAIGIAILLLMWGNYTVSVGLKEHFISTIHNFALHLICLASLVNLFYPFWLFALAAGVSAVLYFSGLAKRTGSVQMLVFVLLYAYAMLTVLFGKVIDWLSIELLAIYLSPLYITALTLFTIRGLKQMQKIPTT